MTDDLVKRLTIKAGVMEMGEKIAWGSDTSLMREAADRIKELERKLARGVEALKRIELSTDTRKQGAIAMATLAELKGEGQG
jgi:selenocysteine lyase/cysteine desulfurase